LGHMIEGIMTNYKKVKLVDPFAFVAHVFAANAEAKKCFREAISILKQAQEQARGDA